MNEVEEFKDHGMQASYHFADDSGGEWQQGYNHEREAMKLYDDNPDLQEEMMKISKGFLWSLKLNLEAKKRNESTK